MEIRKAKKDDQGNIAELMYSSGSDLYDFMYATDKTSPLDYINFEFKSGIGFCGCKHATVAVKDGRVVATASFYDGKNYNKMVLGSLINMFKFYGMIKVWPVLIRTSHVDSVMKPPVKDELYLANFAVSPELRNTGIGTAMLNAELKEAKRRGYRIFSLDVSNTNNKAEALYLRLGLKVTAHNKFSGKREGIDVADAKRMYMYL